jgi:peptidoglycan L-alanyl-D-glutamate endopeptidase CwlK
MARVLANDLRGPASLHIVVLDLSTRLITKAEAEGLSIRITDTFRSFKDQNAIYEKGRTTKGSIVTNARGGESYHNYGLAFDVCFTGLDPYPIDRRKWDKLGLIGEDIGLVWGGRFGDNPHFEYHPHFTWRDIKGYFIL